MAQVCIYRTIYELVDRLADRPALLKGLYLDKLPSQQNISYAQNQLGKQTKATLDAAATGIALEARDHGTISDVFVPTQSSNGDTQNDKHGPTLYLAHPCASMRLTERS